MKSERSNTLDLLHKYIIYNLDGSVDVKGIFSKACFQEWVSKRKTVPKDPYHAYRKAVTGHTRGDKGLIPFSPLIEKAVLIELRKKKVWGCFEGTNHNIGLRGYQTRGFWEAKSRKRDRDSETPLYQKSKTGSETVTNSEKKLSQPQKKPRHDSPTVSSLPDDEIYETNSIVVAEALKKLVALPNPSGLDILQVLLEHVE